MQPLNVSSSITVICDWIITCSSDEQSVNALDLISITEEGMVNLVSFLHPLKALDSIDVTDGGIVILFNDAQLLKVKSLIAAIFEGSSIVTFANEVQSQNAWIPIDFTEGWIVISSRCWTFAKWVISNWRNRKRRFKYQMF